jgi:hypothetical protein
MAGRLEVGSAIFRPNAVSVAKKITIDWKLKTIEAKRRLVDLFFIVIYLQFFQNCTD